MHRVFIFLFFGMNLFIPAGAFAGANTDKVELVCRLVSIQAAHNNSDITVYKRRRMSKSNCPATFTVADADGNVYKLAAIVKATPNVPTDAACGANLDAEIKFDIDLKGRTTNVEAVSGSPEEWVRRSIKAIDKDRYESHLVDGEPIEIKGVRTEFKGIMEC